MLTRWHWPSIPNHSVNDHIVVDNKPVFFKTVQRVIYTTQTVSSDSTWSADLYKTLLLLVGQPAQAANPIVRPVCLCLLSWLRGGQQQGIMPESRLCAVAMLSSYFKSNLCIVLQLNTRHIVLVYFKVFTFSCTRQAWSRPEFFSNSTNNK